jgi:predicted alpha/beta-hydrolase family hydrolase
MHARLNKRASTQAQTCEMKNILFETIANSEPEQAPVRGFLHPATGDGTGFIVLTHGAGGNANAPLLIAVAEQFAAIGINALRCDLPFRQRRPTGPPSPSDAQRDQDGLRRAVALMKQKHRGRAFLGGISYGGRQASMLVASEPALVEGLLLLSYPLHPPGRPEKPRTAHLPEIQVPTLLVSGTRDAFGTPEELLSAIKLIPAPTRLVSIEGAGHGLLQKSNRQTLPAKIVEEFQSFFARPG